MRVVSASLISALMGSVLGASLVVGLTQTEALPSAPPQRDAPGNGHADLARRLEAIERTLASDAPRVHVMPPALASTSAPPSAGEPGALDPGLHADSPAFEAAVLDELERPDRAPALARDDNPRQREEYVTNELTLRLGLSPAQTERLRAVQSQLERQLERERRGPPSGRFPAPEARRAARQALRKAADDQLRAVLAPRQVVAYDALAPDLQLYRPGR
jgi:hypothetical protein